MAEDDTTRPPEEPPKRRGRGNAILTYEAVEEIVRGITRLDLKLNAISEVQLIHKGSTEKRLDDHEARLRTLEQNLTGLTASRGTSAWLWQAVWPVAAVIISLLNFLSK